MAMDQTALSEETKERIRVEESYRHEIRAELAANGGKKRWWELLNSAFVLCVLPTIMGGLGAAVWANWQERAAAEGRWWVQKDTAFRHLWDLDRELDFRLMGYRRILDQVSGDLEPLVKKEKSGVVSNGHPTVEETRQLLSRAYEELDTPRHPAYRELHDLGLYALIAQAELASQERYDSRLPNYNTAKAKVFTLRDLNDGMQGLSRFSDIKTTVDVMDAMLKEPGLGEWYYQAGLNESPDFYNSPRSYVSPLELRIVQHTASLPLALLGGVVVGLCWIAWRGLKRHRIKASTSNT
jgi:hypothetical protein